MTQDDEREPGVDDALRRALSAHNEPPPMPAASIWAGVEAGMAQVNAGRTTRRVHVPLAGAIAASLALFAGGAALGYGMSARDGGAAARSTQQQTGHEAAEHGTTNVVPGDTVQVAWF